MSTSCRVIVNVSVTWIKVAFVATRAFQELSVGLLVQEFIMKGRDIEDLVTDTLRLPMTCSKIERWLLEGQWVEHSHNLSRVSTAKNMSKGDQVRDEWTLYGIPFLESPLATFMFTAYCLPSHEWIINSISIFFSCVEEIFSSEVSSSCQE